MLLKILVGIGTLVGAFLIYVAFQPSEYSISRETVILASADRIFPHLNNSQLMNEWSPWRALDPDVKMTFSGPNEGVGSRTSWENGKKLGTGSATVVESQSNQKVVTQLEYLKPMQMTQEAELAIRPSDSGSVVIWTVRGKNNFIGRVMCTLMNMDKSVGSTFEKGLSNLKNRVERGN